MIYLISWFQSLLSTLVTLPACHRFLNHRLAGKTPHALTELARDLTTLLLCAPVVTSFIVSSLTGLTTSATSDEDALIQATICIQMLGSWYQLDPEDLSEVINPLILFCVLVYVHNYSAYIHSIAFVMSLFTFVRSLRIFTAFVDMSSTWLVIRFFKGLWVLEVGALLMLCARQVFQNNHIDASTAFTTVIVHLLYFGLLQHEEFKGWWFRVFDRSPIKSSPFESIVPLPVDYINAENELITSMRQKYLQQSATTTILDEANLATTTTTTAPAGTEEEPGKEDGVENS
jgi:hypothetical protein